MDSDRERPDVHHPKWRRTPSPQAIAPAKPTTQREYHIWLREQTIQLGELINYGDELADTGLLTIQQQGRDELMDAFDRLFQALENNNIDTIQGFPRLERDHGEVA